MAKRDDKIKHRNMVALHGWNRGGAGRHKSKGDYVRKPKHPKHPKRQEW